MSLATADWDPLGDVFYRKVELYTMGWNIDLSKYIVAVAPCGGPIAIYLDEKKAPNRSQRSTIFMYTAAGREMAAVKWGRASPIIQLGWSSNEDLLCIQDDGSILVYDIFGVYQRTFSMGQEAKDLKVIDCKVFNGYQGVGIAVVTSSYRVFVINNIEDPRVRRLAEVHGLDRPPSSWIMINQDRQLRALVAKDNQLFLLDHGGQYHEQTPPVTAKVNSWIEMSISHNNKHLAMFTDTGTIWIGSSDLKVVHCEFDTHSQTRPLQLAWIDTKAVVGIWEGIMLVVGPHKDYINYSFDSSIYLQTEIDGVRIIGSQTHEFLQKIPESVTEIYKIGSMEPGAMLVEASKAFQNRSQRADEYIRVHIQDKLETAIQQCIQAAGHEFEQTNQKALLRLIKVILVEIPDPVE